MSSKSDKDRAKQIQDKCQVLLTQMLKDEDNKYCVDCDAKGPRWASWNIGIFLCIRCAGIHRNLGVHISKVKSVNLDSWTPEQVVSLQQMGNSRARAVYEANLPDDFRRPQLDSALEQFIRAKYEAKKYIAREWVPPPLPKVNWDKELDEEAEKQKRKKRDSKPLANPVSNIRPLPSVIPQPLPKPVSTSPKPNRTKTNASPTADLLGLDAPFNNGTSSDPVKQETDLFSNFMSAPSNPRSSTGSNVSADSQSPQSGNMSASRRTAEEDSFFNQPASNSPAKTKQQMSTDSILALYGKSQMSAAPGPFSAPPTGMPSNIFGNVQPAASMFPPTDFMIPNGMAHPNPPVQNDMFASMPSSTGVAPGMAAGAPGSMNIVSNPFYSMSASNPANSQLFGISRLPQQLANMTMGGPPAQSPFNLQPQPALNPLGQTLASNLWQ
nr:PREDICTED: stromal membrane-associated protein 1 isoform X2 [Bemisia tabaci]